MDMKTQEIRVRVDHPRGTKFCCPECSKELACYDRRGRAALEASGLVSVQDDFGSKRASRSVSKARCEIRECSVGGARKEPSILPKIGIDEKAFAKGQSYVSMIYDLENSTVEAIQEGRDTEAAVACFSQLSEEQIKSVQAIAMDMSSVYVKAAKQCIPLAEEKIVHDPFHVMKMAKEALNKVRKQEHRSLLKEGDTTLTGSKYVCLTGIANHTQSQNARFESICSLKLVASIGQALFRMMAMNS